MVNQIVEIMIQSDTSSEYANVIADYNNQSFQIQDNYVMVVPKEISEPVYNKAKNQIERHTYKLPNNKDRYYYPHHRVMFITVRDSND